LSRPSSLSFGEFVRRLREMRKLGPFSQILKRLPKPMAELAEGIDEAQIAGEFDNIDLVAAVMMPAELEDPAFLPDTARARELGACAEVPVQEVLDLFEQLEAARRFLSGDGPSPLDL
jgi:signal recognition particle GTPase